MTNREYDDCALEAIIGGGCLIFIFTIFIAFLVLPSESQIETNNNNESHIRYGETVEATITIYKSEK